MFILTTLKMIVVKSEICLAKQKQKRIKIEEKNSFMKKVTLVNIFPLIIDPVTFSFYKSMTNVLKYINYNQRALNKICTDTALLFFCKLKINFYKSIFSIRFGILMCIYRNVKKLRTLISSNLVQLERQLRDPIIYCDLKSLNDWK